MAVPSIRRPWRNSRSSLRTWRGRREKQHRNKNKKNRMNKDSVRNKKDRKMKRIKRIGGRREEMKSLMTFSTPVTYLATWVMILTTLSPKSRRTSTTFRDTPGKEPIDRDKYGRNCCYWDGLLMAGPSDSHSSASFSSFGFGIYTSMCFGINGGLKATFSWWATHYTFGHNP